MRSIEVEDRRHRAAMKYQFASLVYDADAGTLHGADGEIRLRPQVFQLLGVLLREAPRIVDSRTLIDEVWRLPHVSQSSIQRSISELRRALGDDARESRFIDTVHRRGYRFVEKVERIPEPDSPLPAPAVGIHGGRSRRVVGLTFAVAVLGLLVWALARWPNLLNPNPTWPTAADKYLLTSPGTVDARAVRAERPTLAVADFRGLSEKDDSWLASALAELISLHLLQRDEVVVLPRSSVHRAASTADVPAAADSLELAVLARVLPVRYVVGGSYRLAEGPSPRRLELALELVDSTGSPPRQLALAGDEAQLSHLAARAVAELQRLVTGSAGLGTDRSPGAGFGGVLPERLADTAALFRGLEALARDDPVVARERLEEVALKAPDSPLARWALARALAELGWHERARTEVAEALRMEGPMPREITLLATALAQELDGETADSLESYQALAAFYPGDFEHGLAAARSEIRAGEGEAAASRLADLRGLAAGRGDDLRLDLLAAKLAHHDDDVDLMIETARRAAATARELGHEYRLAEALLLGGRACQHRGLRPKALDLLTEATEIFDRLDAPRGAAEARSFLATLYHQQEDFPEARGQALRALESSRRLGDRVGQAAAWLKLGRADDELGDFDLALSEIKQAEQAYRVGGREIGEAAARTSRALILYKMGHPEQASQLIERSLAVYRRLGRVGNVVSSASNLGLIRNELGDFRGAKESLLEALEAVGDEETHRAAYAHFSLGRQALEAMELDEADHHLQLSLDAFIATERRTPIFAVRLQRAGVALARGRPEEASRELEAAREIKAQGDGGGDPSFSFEAVQTRLLLRTGPLDAAEIHLRAAASVLEAGKNPKEDGIYATLRGELLELRGDAKGARDAYEKARRLYADSGRRARADQLALRLARLTLAEQTIAASGPIAAARGAAELFREHSRERGHGAGEAAALAVEAAASLAMGDAATALFEVRDSDRSGPLPAPERHGRELLRARALAAAEKLETARAVALAVARAAADSGDTRWRLEAEIVLCELSSSRGSEAMSHCLGVVREARVLGFEALAVRGERTLRR